MGVFSRNFLNDGAFEDFVRYDFPNSGIYAAGKSTTEMAKELNQYLSAAQAVCASAMILNKYETDSPQS